MSGFKVKVDDSPIVYGVTCVPCVSEVHRTLPLLRGFKYQE